MHAAQAEGRDLLNHLNNESSNSNKNGQKKVPVCEAVPLPKLPGAEAQDVQSFLLSANDMNVRKPALGRQTLSLHLQDQGYGPYALLTYRSMDSELTRREAGEYNTGSNGGKDNQTNNNSGYVAALGRHAQAGVLGRALQGVWLKLLEVMAHEGIAGTCSELDDSSFALMVSNELCVIVLYYRVVYGIVCRGSYEVLI